jgi:hypothetical protein
MTTSQLINMSKEAEEGLEAAREEERKKKRQPSPLKLVPEGSENAIPTQRQLIEAKKESRLHDIMYKIPLMSPTRVKDSKPAGKKPVGLGIHVTAFSSGTSVPSGPFGSKASLECIGLASPSHRKTSAESMMPSSPFRRNANKGFLTPTKEEGSGEPPEEDTPSKAARVLGMNVGLSKNAPAKMLGEDTPSKALKVLGADKLRVPEQEHNETTTKRRGRRSYSGVNEMGTPSRRPKFLDKPARVFKNMTSFANVRASPVKIVNIVTVPTSRGTAASVDVALASSLVDLSGSSSLVRSQSLKFMDNDVPPTPPEKDSLPRALRRAGGQVQQPDSTGLGDVFGDVVIVNDSGQSPTRNGGHGRRETVSVTHQGPEMYASMRGVIEGGSTLSSTKTDESKSIYTGAGSVEEGTEVAAQQTAQPVQSWYQQHHRQSRYSHLQPAFYSPLFYASPQEQKNFKPSGNVSQTLCAQPYIFSCFHS